MAQHFSQQRSNLEKDPANNDFLEDFSGSVEALREDPDLEKMVGSLGGSRLEALEAQLSSWVVDGAFVPSSSANLSFFFQ